GNIIECGRYPWMVGRKHFAPHGKNRAGNLFRFGPPAFVSQNHTQVTKRIRQVQAFIWEQFSPDSNRFPSHRLLLRKLALISIYSTQIVEGSGGIRILFAEQAPANGERLT